MYQGWDGMYFNVSQLMKETSGSSRFHEVDEPLAIVKDVPLGQVVGSVSLLRTDKGVWVSAGLDTQVPCVCSRCLNYYDQPIHLDIEEELFPLVDVATGSGLSRSGDDEQSFHIDRNHNLDLREALRQYSPLSLPMKLVCAVNCRGICPTCGENLNTTACRCDTASIDSRWDAIFEMVPSLDKDN